MIRPTAPAIIKMMPMAPRSTCAGFQVIPNRRIAPMTMSAMLPPIVKDPSPPIVSAAAGRAAAGMSAGPAGAMTAAETSAVLMVPHKPGRTPRPCRGESQLSSSPIVRTACAVHPSRAMCRRPSNGMFAADFGHARGSSGTGGATADPLIHPAGSGQGSQQTVVRKHPPSRVMSTRMVVF
jgi:hypothetical protein